MIVELTHMIGDWTVRLFLAGGYKKKERKGIFRENNARGIEIEI